MTPSKRQVWIGRALSALVILFMVFDGVIHIAKPDVVVQAFAQLGYPERYSVAIGVIEIACVVLALVPRTAAIGALLLTGYFGGAIATQLRIGAPTFNLVFPAILAALLWGGLALRDMRVRRLVPGGAA